MVGSANGRFKAAGNPLIEPIVSKLKIGVKDLINFMKTPNYVEEIKKHVPEYEETTIITEDEF